LHQQPPSHTVIVKANLAWTSTGNTIREGMSKLIYESCGDHYCSYGRNKRIDPYLCLYKGCELMLGDNVDVVNGLANGTRGIFKGITLKPGETSHITCLNGFYVHSVFASQIERLECEHTGSKYTGIFCVEPSKKTCCIQMPNPLLDGSDTRIRQSIYMTQIPLIRNLATTGHKLQGQTKEAIIVSDYYYGSNWVYVVLSRVTTRAGLFLRKPINKNKLASTNVDGRLLLHEAWLRDNVPLR